MSIERAPIHRGKTHDCVCRNCGAAFQAACPKSVWCDAQLCQAAKLRYYKRRIKEKKEGGAGC